MINQRTRDSILSLPDAAVSWKWFIELPIILNSLGNGNSSSFSITAQDVQRIMVQVESFKLTPEAIRTNEFNTQARVVPFPDTIESPSISIVFYEDKDFTVFKYLKNWLNLVISENSTFGVPYGENGYSKTLNVHIFDTAGEEVLKADLLGVYPLSIEGYDFTSENGSLKTTASFAIKRTKFY